MHASRHVPHISGYHTPIRTTPCNLLRGCSPAAGRVHLHLSFRHACGSGAQRGGAERGGRPHGGHTAAAAGAATRGSVLVGLCLYATAPCSMLQGA